MQISTQYSLNTADVIETPSIGQSLLIIGTSITAPVSADLLPVLFKDPRNVVKYYGYNALSRAYIQAYLQGAPYIVTMSIDNSSKLEQALELAVNFDIDILVLPEFYYSASLATLLSLYEYKRMQTSFPTVLVVPASGSYSSLASVSLNDIHTVADDGKRITSPFVVVAAGEIRYNTNTVRQYNTNCAATVAGMIAATKPSRSIINRSLSSITVPVRYATNQLAELFTKGYTCIDKSPKYKEIVYGGRTLHEGDFLDLINSRTAQATLAILKSYTDSVIGETYKAERVRKLIDSALEAAKSSSIIRDYTYYLDIDYYNGLVDIKMELLPYFSIRAINVNTTINLRRTY